MKYTLCISCSVPPIVYPECAVLVASRELLHLRCLVAHKLQCSPMHRWSPLLTGAIMMLQTTMGDEFNDPLFQRALMDVHMMVCLNGHERTVPEW